MHGSAGRHRREPTVEDMTTNLGTDRPATSRNTLRCLRYTVPGAVVGTLVVWGVSRLGDVDLVVGTGDSARTVGWLSVAVMSALAAAAGSLLLVFLEGRFRRGRAIWTAIATVVLLLSLAGPLGGANTEAVIVLVAMHLVVYLDLVLSAWRDRSTVR
jgi:hypothetical protein